MRRSRGPIISGPIGEKTKFQHIKNKDGITNYVDSTNKQAETARANAGPQPRKPIVERRGPEADYLRQIIDNRERAWKDYGKLPDCKKQEPQQLELLDKTSKLKQPDLANKTTEQTAGVQSKIPTIDEPDIDM